jgi:hypothetical protein
LQIRYVNTASTAGGDGTTNNTSGATRAYHSLYDAVMALPASLSEPWTIYCEGSAADTTPLDPGPFDFTTSTANYLLITATQANRHDGKWNTGKYRLEVANSNGLYNNYPCHLRIDGLQIQVTENDGGTYICYKTTNANQTGADLDCRITNCIAKDGGHTTGGITGFATRPDSGTGTKKSVIANCLAVGCYIGFDSDYVSTLCYSDTAAYCLYGFISEADNAFKCVNCLVTGSGALGGVGFMGNFLTGSNYNAEDDGNGAPGAQSRSGTTFTFVNAGAGNYHLASNDSGAKGYGTSLYSDAGFPVTTDIDGQNRKNGTPWDIGADDISNQTARVLAADPGSFSITGTATNLYKVIASSLIGSGYWQPRYWPKAFWSRDFYPEYTSAGHPPLQADTGSFAITGTAASLKRGYEVVAATTSFSLSGTDAAIKHDKKIAAATTSFGLSGTAAVLKRGIRVAADPGAYELTGTAATLTTVALKILSAGAGSFSLTGTVTGIKRTYCAKPDSGSYLLAGSVTALRMGYKLPAASSSFSLTGTTAALRHVVSMGAASASFAVTGTAVGFKRTYCAKADTASFSLAGTAAALKRAYKIPAATTTFILTGAAVSLLKGKGLQAGSVSFSLSGTALTFKRTYRATADPGALSTTGTDATLKAARKLEAGSSSLSLTGTPTGLSRGMRVSAGVGALALTGMAAGLKKNSIVSAGPGAYILDGQEVTLVYYPTETFKLAKMSIRGKSASVTGSTRSASSTARIKRGSVDFDNL